MICCLTGSGRCTGKEAHLKRLAARPSIADSVVQAVLACWETKPSAHHHHDLSDFVAFVVRQMDIGEAVLQVAMAYMFRLKRKVGIL
jgi:hypothetical protein